MAAHTAPIFCKQGDVSTNAGTGMSQGITAAAADYDGAGADNVCVFTAGDEGAYLERLRFKAKGTNVTTVARVYLNNGSAHTSAANNALFDEVNLPATTASATSPTPPVDLPLGIRLPPGFKVYVGLGTAVAAGWVCTAVGGQY